MDQAESDPCGQAYDSVRDAFSTIGEPADEQAKGYIAMLIAAPSLKAAVPPTAIFDFSLDTQADRPLAQKK